MKNVKGCPARVMNTSQCENTRTAYNMCIKKNISKINNNHNKNSM